MYQTNIISFKKILTNIYLRRNYINPLLDITPGASGRTDTISQAASAPAIRTTFSGREGFATLNDVSATYSHDEHNIDIYSQANGDQSCDPNPYSNSRGYLCLNSEQKGQLLTRGHNQTGGN